MANLADGIRQSFLNNLGKEGMQRAYDTVTGSAANETDEEKQRKARLAALKKHIGDRTIQNQE